MSDERLREYFQAMRDAETAEAPSFAQTLARAETPRVSQPSGWRWPAAALAAVSAAVVWLAIVPSTPPAGVAPLEPGVWKLPTDILLDLPGAALLREMPAIGTGIDGSKPSVRTS